MPKILLSLWIWCFSAVLFAQGTARISISGVPTVLSSPFIADLQQGYDAGNFPLQFIYTNPAKQPTDFRFRLRIEYAGQSVVETESEVVTFTPGIYTYTNLRSRTPAINFADLGTLIAGLQDDLRTHINQTGALPEGDYELEIEPIPVAEDPLLITSAGRVLFNVRFPDPSLLLSPADEAQVASATPTFTWLPATVPATFTPEYKLLIVEILEGQTPEDALTGNRRHYESDWMPRRTSLAYTPDLLPFQEGKRYAWATRVRTSPKDLPFNDDGYSEIRTFTYRSGFAPGSPLAALRTLVLEAGFATLTDLTGLTVREEGGFYVLNGESTLNLQTAPAQSLPITLQDLRLSRADVNSISGGQFEVDLNGLALDGINDLVRLHQLRWTFGSGFSTNLQITLPNGRSYAPPDFVRFGRGGLSGNFSFPLPDVAMGDRAVQFTLQNINIRFPENSVTGSGYLNLFGGSERCALPLVALDTAGTDAAFTCDFNENVQLVSGSDLVRLNLRRVEGSLRLGETFSHSLQMNGALQMNIENGASCGADLRINLSTERGFSADNFVPNCRVAQPRLNLGFLDAAFQNVRVPIMNYNTPTNSWDFAVDMDVNLQSQTLENTVFPPINNIRIDKTGISFPANTFTEEDLAALPAFKLGSLDAKVKNFSIDRPFKFDWFNYNPTTAGNWEALALDFDLDIPNLGGILPSCMRQKLEAPRLRFAGARVSFDLPLNLIEEPGCKITLGGEAELLVRDLGANLSGAFSAGRFEMASILKVAGNVHLGEPFECEGASGITVAETRLAIYGDGLFEGRIENLTPTCPIKFGTYTALPQATNLIFTRIGGRQGMQLVGGANLEFAPGQTISGTYDLDVLAGRFNSYRFNLDQPFDWAVPNENPVFTFKIERATLNQDGFLIDGRHRVALPEGGGFMGVTFDNFQVNMQTAAISSGNITFDGNVGFQLDFGTGDGLKFRAVSPRHELSISPGMLLRTAGTIRIDRDGLSLNGNSSAQFRYREWNLDENVALNFRDGFRFSFAPFGVNRGAVDISHNGSRLAYLDASGINLDPNIVGAFAPERIPLPNETVAYLQLRDPVTRRFVVDFTQDGSNYRINTLPGQQVRLYMPALQGTSGTIPFVGISLNNIVINPASMTLVSGEIRANVETLFDEQLPDFPIRLQEVSFGTQEYFGTPITALFLGGEVRLFDENTDCNATLYLQSDLRTRGAIDCRGMDYDIDLNAVEDMIVLNLQNIIGSVDIDMSGRTPMAYSVSAHANLRLNKVDDYLAEPELSYEEELNLDISQDGIRLRTHAKRDLPEPPSIDLGFARLNLTRINDLDLAFTRGRGFTFEINGNLSLRIAFEAADDPLDALLIPLEGIVLNERGISFPPIDLHGETFRVPEIDLGAVGIRPLAFRMPRSYLTWDPLSISILPEFDLELRLSQLGRSSGEVAEARLTINRARVENGILGGELIPYTFPRDGASINFGEGTFNMRTVAGRLFNNSGRQGFDLRFTAGIELPAFSTDAEEVAPTCTQSISGRLSNKGGIEGTISDFAPCGKMNFDPLQLEFTRSEFAFQFGGEDETSQISLRGTVVASLRQEGRSAATATGNFGLNLITGEILESDITMRNFNLQYPPTQPVFDFTVNEARIDRTGFRMNALGRVNFPGGSFASVRFNDAVFGWEGMSLESGNIAFEAPFALEGQLDEGRWKTVPISNPIPPGNVFRLDLPDRLTIDRDGLSISGTATAQLRYGAEMWPSLSLGFNDFALAFGPVNVRRGRMDFNLIERGATTRLAYFDNTGFHPDNIVAILPLPPRLPLGSMDVAYLQLRGGNSVSDPLLIESGEVSPGRLRIRTRPGSPIKAHFPSLSGSPNADVAFELILNTGDFSVVSVNNFTVSTSASLSNQIFGSFPLHLERFELRKPAASPLSLTADIRLNLPASMTRTPVLIEDLTISESGFEGARLRAGTVSNSYQAACATTPFLSTNFADNTVGLALCGFEVQMTGTTISRVAMSGQLFGDFLQDEGGGRQRLHINGSYSAGAWNFGVDFSHVAGGRIAMGFMDLQPTALNLFADASEFYVGLDGRVTFPTLGNDFAITIDGLRMGSQGVILNRAELADSQDFALFDNNLQLHLTRLGLSKPTYSSPLYLTMTGAMDVLEQTGIGFSDFRIGTDGSVSIGAGEVNFLQGRPIDVVEDVFSVDRLVLGIQDNRFYMEAGAEVTLPSPLDSSARGVLRMSLDPSTGNVTIDPMTIAFTFDSTPGNGRGVEFAIPQVATLELSGAGVTLDFQNPEESAFYASASLFIQNNAAKEIQFGRGVDVINNWGIRATPRGLDWRVSEIRALDIETDFFSITGLTITTPIPDRFRLNISGTASLRMAGVSGSATISNMIIDDTGLVSPGTLAGMEISLQSIATIRIGAFTTGSNQDLTLETARGNLREGVTPPDNMVTIPVTEFMRIGASTITVGSAFSGGFTEILYYKQTRGQATESGGTCAADECMAFKIRGVQITFGGDTCGSATFCLTASMEYVQEGSDFLLRVAGSGRMPSADIGFGVVGKIGVRGGQPTFGIFAVVSATIPLYPGVVDLTGVGLGFFYRPEAEDINLVIDVLQSSTDFRVYSPDNIPRSEGMTICVMLYASVGLIGTVGNYTVEAQAFLDFSAGPAGWSFGLQIRGTMLKQGQNLVAGMYLRIEDIRGRLMIAGGAKVLVDYSAVAGGKAEVEFKYIKNGDAPEVWALKGMIGGLNAADIAFKGGGGSPTSAFKIISIIDVNGRFIVCNQGFLFDLNTSTGFDVWVISIRTSFAMSVWYRNHEGIENFGAYAEIGIRASVLGGLAEMGATAKAAFINNNGSTLLYGSARAYVKVLFVFEGSITVWLACENGRWDGGEGSNARYDQMVEDARAQAEEMENIADEAAGALDGAANAMPDLSLSAAELQAAADGLADMTPTARRELTNNALNNERTNGTSALNGVFTTVSNFIVGTDPNITIVENARQRMEASIARSIQVAQDVQTRLQSATATALENLGALESADNNLRNPISNIVADWSGDTPPSYEIDDATAAQNVQNLETIRAEIAALDARYQSAIAAATQNINEIDDALSGAPLLTLQTIMPANLLRNEVIGQYSGAFGGASASSILSENITRGTISGYSVGTSIISNPTIVGVGTSTSSTRTYTPSSGGSSAGAFMTGISSVGMSAVSATLAPVRASNQYSVNYVAGTFTKAIEDIDAFYAKSASSKWKLRDDYVTRLNGINNNASAIAYQVRQMGDNITDKARLLRLGAGRASLLAQLQGLDAAAAGTNFTNTLNPRSVAEVREQTRIKGEEFWTSVPRLALQTLIDRIPTTVDAEFTDYQTKRGEFVDKYNEFTLHIDNLYEVKARMMATLYGMIDQYITWKRGIQGNAAGLDQWNTQRTQFGRLLEPPSITDLRFNPVKYGTDYFNKVAFSWTATHPDGIVEYAFSSDYSTDGADIVGSQPFLTTGIENSIDIYRWKQNLSRNRDVVNIRVKARSAGGNTLVRGAQVTVNVGTGLATANGGQAGGNGLVTDRTPAEILSISIKEGDAFTTATGAVTAYTGREAQPTLPPDPSLMLPLILMPSGSSGGGGLYGTVISGGFSPVVASGSSTSLTQTIGTTSRTPGLWINATDQFEFSVQARDNESDIATFEYALGTTSGGNEVKDWQPLVGARTRSSNGATVTVSSKVRSLNLAEDQTYYLSVRAKNGQGWWSQYRQVTPIRVDITAPTRPTETTVISGGGSRFMPSFSRPAPSPIAPFSTDPVFLSPRVATVGAPAPIVKAVAYTASSDIAAGRNYSGIKHYRYIISTQTDSSRAFSRADSIYTTAYLQNQLEAAKLDYLKTFYVYFWAEDYAGNKSAVTRSAPFQVRDPSVPRVPSLQVGRKSSYLAAMSYLGIFGLGVSAPPPESPTVEPTFGLGITQLSADPESDVEGYQISVGTTPGGQDIRPFRATGVDYAVSREMLGTIATPSTRPPLFAIATDGLPIARDLYVNIRAVNKQGMTSDYTTSGPLKLDNTRPLVDRIEFNSISSSNFEIRLTNMRDSEMGIQRVRYQLLNATTRAAYGGATDLLNLATPRMYFSSPSFTVPKPAGLGAIQPVILQITITNGIGLTTVREVTYTPYYSVSGTSVIAPVSGFSMPRF